MQLQQLRYFVEVSRVMNFTKAAERLYMTQSTLSRQIAALEEELGFSLFIRHSKGLELTAEGSLFLVESKNLLEDYDTLIDKMRDIREGLQFHLSIGFTGDIEMDFLGNLIREFFLTQQNINLKFQTGSFTALNTMLDNGSADLILIPLSCLDLRPGIEYLPVVENCLGCVMPKDHPLSGKSSIKLADLKGENLILGDTGLTTEYNRLVEKIFKNDPSPNIVLYENNSKVRILYIIARMGVSFMSSQFVRQYSDEVAFAPVEDLDDDVNIVFAWKKDNRNPAIKMLVSHLELMEK